MRCGKIHSRLSSVPCSKLFQIKKKRRMISICIYCKFPLNPRFNAIVSSCSCPLSVPTYIFCKTSYTPAISSSQLSYLTVSKPYIVFDLTVQVHTKYCLFYKIGCCITKLMKYFPHLDLSLTLAGTTEYNGPTCISTGKKSRDKCSSKYFFFLSSMNILQWCAYDNTWPFNQFLQDFKLIWGIKSHPWCGRL